MNRHDYVDLYTRGWADGDVPTMMRALADDFVFDNPRVGKITKSQFESYFKELQKFVTTHRRGSTSERFMEFGDVVRDDDGTTLTNWTWWRIPGTKLEGAGLMKVTDYGVVSHRAAFYAIPQW